MIFAADGKVEMCVERIENSTSKLMLFCFGVSDDLLSSNKNGSVARFDTQYICTKWRKTTSQCSRNASPSKQMIGATWLVLEQMLLFEIVKDSSHSAQRKCTPHSAYTTSVCSNA